MPRPSLKGGKMLMVRGKLTEPAAWISVIAEVVIESGSMSELARFGSALPQYLAEELDMIASDSQGTTTMRPINWNLELRW